jgi:hypothetical protein
LGKKNGGELLFSPGESWTRTTDEHLGYIYGFAAGQEAVFGFRGGGAASFDSFALYVPNSDTRNLKEIELFAGDEGPAGTFRSLGVMTVANGMVRDGWQEFKLPTTTARFFKVKLLSNYGGNDIYLYELRLYGVMAQAGAAPSPIPSRTRTNILAQKQGGDTIFVPGENWKRLIDENLGYIYGFSAGQEGVFGFRDGRAATFDLFSVYVPSTDSRNIKEIEVFAGDAGPTGAFRSLGVVTVVNGRVREGWQEFRIPQTTAKFFKVKLISNYGGNDIYLYEIAVHGDLY